MNILQIIKYYYPAMTFGGPVRCSYNLCEYLAKKGHKVTVYTTDALNIDANTRIETKHEFVGNVEVFRFPVLSRVAGLFISPRLIAKLRENIGDFDIVHLHEYRSFQNIVYYYINAHRVPYVMTLHGQLFTAYVGDHMNSVALREVFDSFFGKRLLTQASKVLALTETEAEKCSRLGVESTRMLVVPNGVDPADFSKIPDKGDFKREFSLNADNMILYLGRIDKRKGIDILIKACSRLFKQRENAKLVIAGADFGFLSEARALVRLLGVENKVLFSGGLSREQVLAAYNDASVVVYAGIQEGFPIVPLEAGIMGKPVVVSEDPATDFVKRGRFGLSVKYGNVLQLEEVLKFILDNPEKAAEMGSKGQTYIRSNYSWNVIGKKIEDIYYNILKE